MEPRAWGKEGEQAAEKYVYAPINIAQAPICQQKIESHRIIPQVLFDTLGIAAAHSILLTSCGGLLSVQS